MSTWREPHDADSGPIDVAAVNRDDAFIDDLAEGRPTPVATESEYDLAVMITAWRSDALSAPIPAEPTLAQIESSLRAREGRGSLSRRLRVVSGAAAVLAVFGAGLLVLSEGAEPGDPLWAVKEVVFSEQAQQTKARVNVEDKMRAAEDAFRAGDEAKARALISEAESELGPVGDADVIDKLRDRIQDLRVDVPDLPRVTLPTLPTRSPTEDKTLTTEVPTTDPDTTTEEPGTTQPPSSTSSRPSKPSSITSKPSTTKLPSSTAAQDSSTAFMLPIG